MMGLVGASTAVVVWGVSSVLIKGVEGLSGLGLACYRIWLGAAIITAAFLASGGRLSIWLLRRSLFGGLAFAADLVLFFVALQKTSVANATVIGALQPLLLLLVAGPMFGERPRLVEVGWGAVAVAGTALVVVGGDGGGANSLAGDLLAVGALVAWTAYFIFSKSARQELSALEYLTGMAIVAAVAVVPLPLFFEGTLGVTDANGWLTIFYITVINGLLGHYLMVAAHGHVSLLMLSLLTLGIPVLAAAAAALWIDEPLSVPQLAGMAVVLSALGVVSVRTARQRPDIAEADLEAIQAAPYP